MGVSGRMIVVDLKQTAMPNALRYCCLIMPVAKRNLSSSGHKG
jgi:hypothetical protein